MQLPPRSKWMRPLAALYGAGVRLRNWSYDRGILRQTSYPIPIICVGNLAVGGSGKTPHVELIVELLKEQYKLAVLSRGYKRKSKGLQLATRSSTAKDVGDEPAQIKEKYPEVIVVVDANRRRAISYLLSLPEAERPEVVILDDGFQHRRVKPSFSILLTDYHEPFYADKLMPVGRLRENVERRYAADCVVVTRSPMEIKPIDQRIIERNLSLYPHQHLFFSEMQYAMPRPVFMESAADTKRPSHSKSVFAVASIARPRHFFSILKHFYPHVETIAFDDHRNFTAQDVDKINMSFASFLGVTPESDAPLAICTEKDVQRLRDITPRLSPAFKRHLYQLPMRAAIKFDRLEEFAKLIRGAAQSTDPVLPPTQY